MPTLRGDTIQIPQPKTETSFGQIGLLAVNLVVLVAILGYLYKFVRRLMHELDHTRVMLTSERSGRITAEKKLRERIQTERDAGNDARFRPIGYIRSPFGKRTGTPRQGGLVSSVRALVELENRVEPSNSLYGLEQYSHVWLIWEFHENTNTASSSIKSKVVPPRAGGEKVGIYATRTPHRHNPIGLSLVRLDRISASRKGIWVLGADLLDGTPILDIKPYIPNFESVPHARVPQWVGTKVENSCTIEWTPKALQDLRNVMCLGKLQFYGHNSMWTKDLTSLAKQGQAGAFISDEDSEFKNLVETITTLCERQDVRSSHQREHVQAKSYSLTFDRILLHLEYEDTSIRLTQRVNANFEEKHDELRASTILKRRNRSIPRGAPSNGSADEEQVPQVSAEPQGDVVDNVAAALPHVRVVGAEYHKPVSSASEDKQLQS